MSLELRDLQISVEGREIIRGLSLVLPPGEVHAVMGPNGAGKSTLLNAVMGHPRYAVTSGEIQIDGKDITKFSPDKKARAGLFLSPQHAPEIPGVSVAHFLRLARRALTGKNENPLAFQKELTDTMKDLGIDSGFASRYVNVGMSGGEKKRLEILQLVVLNPRYALLDETDSGLDVDALKAVGAGINQFRGAEHGLLLITHYSRILKFVEPDVVYILVDGKIAEKGGKELAERTEKEGYEKYVK